MKATDILSEEHRVILRVLDALESAAEGVGLGKPVQPEFFIRTAEFIKGFADGCHHRKEENVLFKAMADSGVPVQGGPIGVMLHEHELGRQFTREMRQAAQNWQAGDNSGRQAAAKAALDYIALLRQHIAKEDNVLFPMANHAIPVSQQDNVAEDFERVEHEETGEGIHEKYLAIAESLEKQAAAWE